MTPKSSLQLAVEAAIEFRAIDPEKAGRQLRQAQFFVTYDKNTFAPVNRCFGFISGVPYASDKTVSLGRNRRIAKLHELGMHRYRPNSDAFMEIFEALDLDCRNIPPNRGVGSHFGDDRTKGKEIWVPNPTFLEIQSAFRAFDKDNLPDGFGPPDSWFVEDPETEEHYPAKVIWGLATNQRGADFDTGHARGALSRIGFNCASLSDAELHRTETREERPLLEGADRQISTSVKERNLVARNQCIEHFRDSNGLISCQICQFNFYKVYGPLGKDFIHVHHLEPMSDRVGEYEITPCRDLIPVCPNCHAMIHRGGISRPIKEVIGAMNTTRDISKT